MYIRTLNFTKALCDAADLDCVSVSWLRYESQEISWALLINVDIENFNES